MCQKASGNRLSYDQRNYRMSFHAGGSVTIRSRRSGQKNSGSLFATPVCLAFYVYDGDDRRPFTVHILVDNFTHTRCQRISLFKANFSAPRAGKMSLRVRDDAEKSRRVFTQPNVCREHRAWISCHG
jgi:hypothetical protein